ncbi:MAG: metal ABC transporter permease [Candidatus Latescibacteria bacterium]|nr:metal ABC transporter permease [Candidatus Latescibacterota bacterium]
MVEVVQFLFPSFVACLSVLAILGYLGIHVIEREIIFIDIALAQIAATGSTLAFVLFRQKYPEGQDFLARIFAIGFTIVAAAFFSYIAKKVSQISQETVIGVSYAISAAATLFLLAVAAGGDVHMEEMFTGSILWAQWPAIFICMIVYALVGIFHFVFRKQFIRLSTGYSNADKQGMNVMWWDFLFYASMGLVITYTVEMAGVLLTFAFLIIPATFSAMFFQNWSYRLVVAWVLGLLVSIAGLAFSYWFDFSCGPSMVAIMGVVLIAAASVKRIFAT